MKTKNTLTTLVAILFLPILVYSAITTYNHYPILKPSHILDEKKSDISFAFSMRVLESDFDGSLIKLRRSSDNALQNFGWGDDDKVDIAAINLWRSGSNVYLHTWYDQSGLERDAVQTVNTRQPRFYPDATIPYFQGDGDDDHLIIDTPNGIQDVTNSGDEGTVLAIMRATAKNQHTFGVLRYTNRWSTHVNWGNNTLYFDSGSCCDSSSRSIYNASNVNQWTLYTFMHTNSHTIFRINAIEKSNKPSNNTRCTLTDDFAIGWANGDGLDKHSNTSFLEFIMYKKDVPSNIYQKIEENSMTFWGM